jgi:hypothetical protein
VSIPGLNFLSSFPETAKKGVTCWVPMAYGYNPSYSGGRDQEDHGLKPAWANSLQDPVSKILITKMGWWSGLRCRPWVQTPVLQKINNKGVT